MAGAAVARQVSDLADGVQEGIREAATADEPPFNLSRGTSTSRVDDALAQLAFQRHDLRRPHERRGPPGEVITGLISRCC